MWSKLVLAILLFLLALIVATGGLIYLDNKVLDARITDAETEEVVSVATINVNGYSFTPDSVGRFRLEQVRTGLQVDVSAPGYLPYGETVNIPWWQKRRALDVRLTPASLRGVVGDAETGAPLQTGVSVVANGLRGETGEDGRFSMGRIAPPFSLEVSAPGYKPWRREVAALEELNDEIEVRLEPVVVSGVVIAADDGKPMPGVAVRFEEQETATDDEGRFELHRLPVGGIVSVTPPDVFKPLETAYRGEESMQLAVSPQRVSVTVYDNFTGLLLPGTVVGMSGITTTTNAQGVAAFERVPVEGELEIFRSGYFTKTVSYTADNSDVEAVLQPHMLQGYVRDGTTGEPLPRSTLYVDGQVIRTDDDGYFSITNLSPDLTITVKAAGYLRTPISVRATSGVSDDALQYTRPCASPPGGTGPLCLDLVLQESRKRGLYIPFGLLSKREKLFELIDLVDRSDELNSFVIDIKSDRGLLGYESKIPLAIQLGVSQTGDKWVPIDEMLKYAKDRNIYTIARIVTFKDDPLTQGMPDYAVIRADGTTWLDGEGLGWSKPYLQEVQDYNIEIAKEVAALGFDEVQFDYIRFPSDGKVSEIYYPDFYNDLDNRTDAITQFLARVEDALRPYGVFTSIDIFGLTVWVKPTSDMYIGQRVMDMAQHVDYICPMVYPQTFESGNLGYDDPLAHPYDIVYRSQLEAYSRVPPGTKVRPWLQAYWYSTEEMLLEKQGAEDALAPGWTFWNAGGQYDPVLFGIVEVASAGQ